MRIKLLLLIFLIGFTTIEAQRRLLSSEAEISVLTIGPGTSLNDAFGHNAFRIKDRLTHIDMVFNYGVYDFDTPNFYTKFAQGKLNYLLGGNYYDDFFESYIAQNRTIEEQVLNLDQAEKQKIFDYLINNYKPENRAYLYDFFYDNCATKIRDVLVEALPDNLSFSEPKGFQQETFRTLIHSHLNENSWGSFGIDVALGSVIDKTATAEEHMFLPTYINAFFDSASFASKDLVKQNKILYQKVERKDRTNFFTSPLFILGLIAVLVIFITYKDYKKQKRSRWLDLTIFIITGSIGIVLLLLWFATNHTATANNYNLLWAFALNLFVVRQLFKKTVKTWFVKYLKFLVILLCLLSLHWLIGVQIFAMSLIPLLIALLIRYLYLIRHFRASENQ